MCTTQTCSHKSNNSVNQGVIVSPLTSEPVLKESGTKIISLNNANFPSLVVLDKLNSASEKGQSEILKTSTAPKLAGFGLLFEKFAFTFSTGLASMAAMFVTCPCPSHLGIIPTILGISFVFDKVLNKSLKSKK